MIQWTDEYVMVVLYLLQLYKYISSLWKRVEKEVIKASAAPLMHGPLRAVLRAPFGTR